MKPEVARRPRSTIRAEQKAYTRRKIMDTAMSLFAEKGYVKTTVEDIVFAAQTTRSSFYAHFKNKAEVVVESIREVTRGTAFGSLKCDGRPPTLPEVREWINAMLDYWQAVRDRESVFRKALEVEPELAAMRASELERYLMVMEAILVDTGRQPGERTHIEAMLLFAQINRFFDVWNEHNSELDHELVVTVMADQIWRQLASPGPKVR